MRTSHCRFGRLRVGNRCEIPGARAAGERPRDGSSMSRCRRQGRVGCTPITRTRETVCSASARRATAAARTYLIVSSLPRCTSCTLVSLPVWLIEAGALSISCVSRGCTRCGTSPKHRGGSSLLGDTVSQDHDRPMFNTRYPPHHREPLYTTESREWTRGTADDV